MELALRTALALEGGGTPRCSGGCAAGPVCLLMLLAAYVGTGPARLMSKTRIGKENKRNNASSLQVQFLFWQIHLNLVVK